MDNLYIQIENGQPVGHPFFESNLIQCYGKVPSDFAPFNRIDLRSLGLTKSLFQNFVSTYTLSSDGVTWQDNWAVVDMTDAEKEEKINRIINSPPGPNSTFNLDKQRWSPTIKKPSDGKKYNFDFRLGQWVEISNT